MAVLMSTTLLVPTFADGLKQATQASIVYLEEYDGYYVKNVSPQKIIDAFDNDPQFTSSGNVCLVAESGKLSVSDAVAEAAFTSVGSNYDETMATTFDRTYQVTATTHGAYGENITLTYTAVLTLKTVTVGGKSYESFASIKIHPTCALPSGLYVLASGASDPLGEIVKSGSRFLITHIVQLETCRQVQVTSGVSNEWLDESTSIEGSISIGDTIYLRDPVETITRTITLPIYNIIY